MSDDWDDGGYGDDDNGDDGEAKGRLPNMLHKALVTGVSAVLMTEEGIRNAVSDMRLPKEAIGYIVQQTERGRKDLFQALTHEVKGFLSSADVPAAVRKALTGLKVEVRADIRFVEDDRTETEVSTSVSDREGSGNPEGSKVDPGPDPESAEDPTESEVSRPPKSDA